MSKKLQIKLLCDNTCTICLETIRPNQITTILGCRHVFHKKPIRYISLYVYNISYIVHVYICGPSIYIFGNNSTDIDCIFGRLPEHGPKTIHIARTSHIEKSLAVQNAGNPRVVCSSMYWSSWTLQARLPCRTPRLDMDKGDLFHP